MRKILLTLFFILFAFPVYAYELLMAHNPGCGICQKFINEVAVDYNDSEASKTLPLIIISVYDQPEWFKEAYAENRIKSIRGTPTLLYGMVEKNWLDLQDIAIKKSGMSK